jgi:two-component system sensor histidine kinase KdpD
VKATTASKRRQNGFDGAKNTSRSPSRPYRCSVRGELRVHLGAAHGVGTTFAMLDEARRRQGRGAKVVVAAVDARGRAPLADLAAGLPRVASRPYGDDIDVELVLAAAPDVVVVDQLAHVNANGTQRWQDVERLLDDGMDVLTTLNVSEIESLRDVTGRILGQPPAVTVPDAFVDGAQVELVDMTPQALQRRLAHGTLVAANQLDAAAANQFRLENLSALRELTLRWMADHVELGAGPGVELVAVALSGAPASAIVVRRAAQLADRLHGHLVGIHVRASGRRAAPVVDPGSTIDGRTSDGLADQRVHLEELGGTYREVAGSDIAEALVRTAVAAGATQLVLGASAGRRSLVNDVLTQAGSSLDVHVIGGVDRPRAIPRGRPVGLARRRVMAGWILAGVGLPIMTAVLVAERGHIDLSSGVLSELLVVLAVAAVGGAVPAVAAAVAATALLNWYLIPPLHHWRIAAFDDVLALSVFLIVASVVGSYVASAARRSAEAARARAEAATLAGLAASSVSDDPLPALVEQLRDAFDLTAAAVRFDGKLEAVAGTPDPLAPPPLRLALADGGELILHGRTLTGEDQSVLRAFTDHLQAALRARQLQRDASSAHALAEADELKNALLSAVSHDLRTPLATIKASISSLLQEDVEWDDRAVRTFLLSVDEETDRLAALVANILDMGRLRVGALQMLVRPVGIDEVVSSAVHSLGPAAQSVEVAVPETLPHLQVDAALLERALANVIANAVHFGGGDGEPDGCRGGAVRVEAALVGPCIHVRVVDRGPGIRPADRERIFQPFQQLGDRRSSGVGLGLAVARGFVEAMGGELTAEDTPGGGATMVVRLPVEE